MVLFGLGGCHHSPTGSQAGPKKAKNQSKNSNIKLSGNIHRLLSPNTAFSDTLRCVQCHLLNVDLGSNPGWLKSKIINQGEQVILYGTTPNKEVSKNIALVMKAFNTDNPNGPASNLAVSFSMKVTND